MSTRRFRWAVPIAALVALLIMAAPAWAGTVQIQDDAHVLNATVVQNNAARLPVGVYVWTTTQDAASKSAFDTDVRNKVNATFPIVLGINTQSRHESIQIGSQAGLSQDAALAVESTANSAFVSAMHSSNDYTAAVTAALERLRTGLAGAHRARAPARTVAPHSSGGGGFLLILVLIGAIVVVAVLVARHRRSGSRAPSMASGSPPMQPYPGSSPDYGPYGPQGPPPYRSGMGAGAAGAIGAVGGGLLGYELGKMHGEDQQFSRDETIHERGEGSADQDNWVVGQDSDFGDGGPPDGGSPGDSSAAGGDW